MEKNPLFTSVSSGQLALVLILLLTFSTGLKVGGHVAGEFKSSESSKASQISGPHFPYELSQPVRKLALPAILSEASAVSYVDGSSVALLQDELGSIFIYSLFDAGIIREIPFANSGDFEGLVVRDNRAWALRSDGDIYRIDELHSQQPQSVKIETRLKGKDDTEGLSYDAMGKQLLISLKEPPKLVDGRVKNKRAVFAFNIEGEYLSDAPFLLLDMNDIKRVYASQVQGQKAASFDPAKKHSFQPSDLAVHPITGHIYHIAARGQLLVVSDRSGQVYFVRELPKSDFSQPEGICFDPRGNMFIVNEGAGGTANLLEFSYQPIIKKAGESASVKSFTLL